jgi:hypothetical protein
MKQCTAVRRLIRKTKVVVNTVLSPEVYMQGEKADLV